MFSITPSSILRGVPRDSVRRSAGWRSSMAETSAGPAVGGCSQRYEVLDTLHTVHEWNGCRERRGLSLPQHLGVAWRRRQPVRCMQNHF